MRDGERERERKRERNVFSDGFFFGKMRKSVM
jgi:hypothetical protein